MSDPTSRLGLHVPHAGSLLTKSPTTGEILARFEPTTRAEYDALASALKSAGPAWRKTPAPVRGQLVRRLGDLFREHKSDLAELITLEAGKITSESLGEVQEMIDVCEFAVGLSRQLHGLTIASERPEHRMMEQWHPLGTVGIITAFNFPMAVWAWNAALGLICGNTCMWKPSELTPLTALAVHTLAERARESLGLPKVFGLVIGGGEQGQWLAEDARLALVSFTGSVRTGREVARTVAGRLGRSLLELGGNNAVIVLKDADLDLATRAITFGAVGTAGQRCTTTRRLFVERPILGEMVERLERAYRSVKIGDPRAEGTLMGPLIDGRAVTAYETAIAGAKAAGGRVAFGGKRVGESPSNFVEPTLIVGGAHGEMPVAWDETFAPILYVFGVDSLDEAIAANNAVTQGLSSALFTDSVRAAERFLAAEGSDCGIANVNLGTSGAEIGGAFGGEKDTGGGRESGSDAWKAYMRRQTSTVNYGTTLPLAQGVTFL